MKAVANTIARHTPQNQAINTEVINDQYIKGSAQLTCGEGDFTQKILSGIDWKKFFNNSETKNDLIKDTLKTYFW